MVVGVLVSTPSLCGEEKGPWTLGKVTVDRLNKKQTGGLDKEELKINDIKGVRIVKDVFGNNEVWTDSVNNVSKYAGAETHCPAQCKFLDLDWNGGYWQNGVESNSHCGCTDKKARLEKGEYIDYHVEGLPDTYKQFFIKGDENLISIYPSKSKFDENYCRELCPKVGKDKFEYEDVIIVQGGKALRGCKCKKTKAAQEKMQQETVDKLMEPVKALQKK